MKNIRPSLEAGSASILVLALLTSFVFFLYVKSTELLENEIKRGLASSAAAAASMIDGDRHKLFNANTSRDDPLYIDAIMPLEKIRRATSDIRYIYTNILVGKSIYFILNPSPQEKVNGVEPLAPALMEVYENPPIELVTALNENAIKVSKEHYQDKWGKFYSAYAPFYDKNGALVGTLGMDLEISLFEERVQSLEIVFEKTFIIIIFISLLVGVVIYLSRKYSLLLQNELHSNVQMVSDLDCFYTHRLQEIYCFIVESYSNKHIVGEVRDSLKLAKEYYASFLIDEKENSTAETLTKEKGTKEKGTKEYIEVIEVGKCIHIPGVSVFVKVTNSGKYSLADECKLCADQVVNINRIIQSIVNIDHIKENIGISIVKIKEQTHTLTLEFHVPVSSHFKDLMSRLHITQDLNSADPKIRNRIQLICAVNELLKCGAYIYNYLDKDNPVLSIGIEAIKT